MADEVLVDSIWLDGKECHKGQLVEVKDDEQRKALREVGVLGDKGTLDKRAKVQQERDDAEAALQMQHRGLLPLPKRGATGEDESNVARSRESSASSPAPKSSTSSARKSSSSSS